MSFFVKAACEALKRHPIINSSVDGSDIIYHGYQDISVAVSTDKGLVTPVLRDAQNMGFAEIEKAIAGYAKKAREGGLTLDDLQGGTFTITNGGTFGSLFSTPIVNPPQSAILGMPFIIRGLSLLGIASAGTARAIRDRVWEHLASDWKPAHLDVIANREVTLSELPPVFDTMLAGRSLGRTVVKVA